MSLRSSPAPQTRVRLAGVGPTFAVEACYDIFVAFGAANASGWRGLSSPEKTEEFYPTRLAVTAGSPFLVRLLASPSIPL